MSKPIKVEDRIYQELDKLRVGRQTFSDAVGYLIDIYKQVLELTSVLEGQLKYLRWRKGKEGD